MIMNKKVTPLVLALTTLLAAPVMANEKTEAAPKKWTFLLFLNGNNNLDSYGYMNINQMEKIGSDAANLYEMILGKQNSQSDI